MLNQVILIGRLTRDPELRYTSSKGTPVATFTLAVNRDMPAADGQPAADFVDIVVWNKLGELCAQYLSKGKPVAVVGRLQIRTYDAKDGSKRKVAEVVADKVRFLGGGNKPEKAQDQAPQRNIDGDDYLDYLRGGLPEPPIDDEEVPF